MAIFDKTITNTVNTAEQAVEKATDHAVSDAEAAGTRIIKITTDWAQTHRLKISGSGSFELHVELVPKDMGPETPQQ